MRGKKNALKIGVSVTLLSHLLPFSRVWKKITTLFLRAPDTHNEMREAPENWDRAKVGVYVRGLR